MERDDEDNVLIYADSILLIDPRNIQAYNIKFQILTWKKDYSGALELVKSLEKTDDDYYVAKFGIGILSEKLGDTVTAKEYYQKSLNLINREIESGNDDFNLWVDKTSLLTLLNKKDSANLILDSLINENPDFEEILLKFKMADRNELLDFY